MPNWYEPGSHNFHCDVCGFKFKSSVARLRWDGLYVCPQDFEHDHPQKYIRVTERAPSVPWVRHQTDSPDTIPPDILVCTIRTRSGYAGLGTAGCMKAGNQEYTYQYLLSHT